MMVRSIIILIGCMLLITNSLAQNLVPNPSFEEFKSDKRPRIYMGCHEEIKGQVCEEIGDYLTSWYSPTSATPDIWTGDPQLKGRIVHYEGLNTSIGAGYKRFAPRTGDYCAGLFTYLFWLSSGLSYREYIQTKLIQPLIVGRSYYAEMYVLFKPSRLSLDDPTLLQTGPYLSNIGFHFSVDSIGHPKYNSHHYFLNQGLPMLKADCRYNLRKHLGMLAQNSGLLHGRSALRLCDYRKLL